MTRVESVFAFFLFLLACVLGGQALTLKKMQIEYQNLVDQQRMHQSEQTQTVSSWEQGIDHRLEKIEKKWSSIGRSDEWAWFMAREAVRLAIYDSLTAQDPSIILSDVNKAEYALKTLSLSPSREARPLNSQNKPFGEQNVQASALAMMADIDMIKALLQKIKPVDTIGLWKELDALLKILDNATTPSLAALESPSPTPALATGSLSSSMHEPGLSFWQSSLHTVLSFMRIRHYHDTEGKEGRYFTIEDQDYYLVQAKLIIEQAKIAVLLKETDIFQSAIQEVRWIVDQLQKAGYVFEGSPLSLKTQLDHFSSVEFEKKWPTAELSDLLASIEKIMDAQSSMEDQAMHLEEGR